MCIRDRGHWFVPLITVSEEEYRRVDPVLRPIPGVFFRRIEARAYPEGATTGHVTGYLGEVTPEMLEAYPEREYVSGEITGRAGLESSRDDSPVSYTHLDVYKRQDHRLGCGLLFRGPAFRAVWIRFPG